MGTAASSVWYTLFGNSDLDLNISPLLDVSSSASLAVVLLPFSRPNVAANNAEDLSAVSNPVAPVHQPSSSWSTGVISALLFDTECLAAGKGTPHPVP